MSTWELEHSWSIVRYLVYYLLENLVPPELIPGQDIIDFSAGIGDLSLYMAEHQPKSILATVPEAIGPPELLQDHSLIRFQGGISGREISEQLPAQSADLFVGRMVFQFPTEEFDRVDVDAMLAQIYEVLRPGGRLILASHQYTELDRQVKGSWHEDLEQYFSQLRSRYSEPYLSSLNGLIELVQTIGIPPREGNHGQTGFGLKPLMMVDSLLRAGFQIERSEEIEDFTFPIGLSRELEKKSVYYQQLSEQVFAIKRYAIQQPAYTDKYSRPGVLRQILQDISAMHAFVTIPIFALQARK